MSRRTIVIASLLLVAACATTDGAAPLAETTAGLSMHDFMKTVIDPAANTVFAAGNEDDPDAPPTAAQTDAKWKAALAAAGVIQESGRLLLTPPRAVAEKTWTDTAQLMVDAGAAASAAVAARDVNAAFEAGGKLYDACNGCHAKYVHGRS